ncbi:MAG: hypothetical protein K2K41_09255 [Ruminiclostridium sp.]|nr:hypothetical protein [Ruminiclostridium sp.]
MLHKPKILIIDELETVLDLMEEAINFEKEYELFQESKKINSHNVILKEKPDFILLCADSSASLLTADSLLKLKECPPFVLMGKLFENENDEEAKAVIKRFKPLDVIKLPFELDEICERIEDVGFTAEGYVDGLTGLWKKPVFDYKLNKLMKKKPDGVFFSVSLNAYSFAANPSTPLQIQMSVFALKKRFEDALLGISGNIVLGFLPTNKPVKDTEKRINDAIDEMLEAAEKPIIYIPAGACESKDYNYSPEDMLIAADKAMAWSGYDGKNRVKFFK